MICFESLTYQNFLSVGNHPTTIQLNETKTTLVHGLNGSGKSTILDVLCYALFNKPFRRINLPQLVNSQNKKGLLTEVVFRIGRDEFKVLRGQKPKIFKIFRNGEEIDSKAADRDNQTYLEQNILKLTYKSFTQIVILGSSNFIPFMQLSSAGRRECVEDFLDIKVFSTMSVIAKERLRGLKDSLHTLTGDIGNIEFKIDVQEQHIKEVESKSDADIQLIMKEMAGHENEIDKDKLEIESLQKHIKAQAGIIADLLKKDPRKKCDELTGMMGKLEARIDRNQKNITFYESNDTCHTCNQNITKKTKTTNIKRYNEEIDKFRDALKDAESHMGTFEGSLRVIKQNQEYVAELQKSVYKLESRVESNINLLRTLQNRLEDLQNSSHDIYKDKGKLELLQCDHACALDKKYDLLKEIEDHEIVNNLLKDNGIKTQIVKKYLPVMNRCIRRHLEEFDLPIHFILDEEFNESVHSPIHQDFSYASFSEGQKSRIDLALMFTWREIGKLKNSVTTNLLVLDEVFSSSLDEDGKERLINFLRYKLDESQRVVVVDHTLSGNFKEKFDRCIEVQRRGGFSSYD